MLPNVKRSICGNWLHGKEKANYGLKIFSGKPITKKPLEVRMGKGKEVSRIFW